MSQKLDTLRETLPPSKPMKTSPVLAKTARMAPGLPQRRFGAPRPSAKRARATAVKSADPAAAAPETLRAPSHIQLPREGVRMEHVSAPATHLYPQNLAGFSP